MTRERKSDEERWALGSSLQPDERRYVLELFPESRAMLKLSPEQWLSQVEFLVKKDGSLDLRKRYCRLPAVPGEPDRRFHRAPRYEPLPEPPQRHAQPQQQLQPPADPEQREQQQPQQPDLQLLPAEPGPSRSTEDKTYGVRVYQAYRDLAEQYQSPDVRIDALHAKVGGSLQDLHRWLSQACRDHLAVPSTGEPALADHAARQSALTLPGEVDRATGKVQSFLLIKLIEPPTMTQEQPMQHASAPPEPGRRLTRDELDVIIEALEYRCDAIEAGTDFDETARLKSIVPTLEKLRVLESQPQRPEHERYERLLRATAALRYPPEERTAELEARIEKTIARKVQEFTQERQLREYEQSLRRTVAERHPNLTEEQRLRYNQRILDLVAERREELARQQQQAQPPAARSQQQGRGIER